MNANSNPAKIGTPVKKERATLPDYSHLPEPERPLNIFSRSNELIAREMSNFEQAPFKLDGRCFQSVEGFYVWLKFAAEPEKQAQAQKLYGYEAKKFGKSSKAKTTEYNGLTIVLGSKEHHALIKRAVQAKLQQHPDIARRFAETYPRPIIHDLGHPEPPSRLPAKDFVKLLTQLRQDLIDGKIITIEGPVSQLSARAKATQRATPTSNAMKEKDLLDLRSQLHIRRGIIFEPLTNKFARFPAQPVDLP